MKKKTSRMADTPHSKRSTIALSNHSAVIRLIIGIVLISVLITIAFYNASKLRGAIAEQTAIISENPFWGNPAAKVKIVEFTNYTCIHCALFSKRTADMIRKKYEDRVLFVHKDYPFSKEGAAFSAAVFARCAQQQGKFWEVNALLFSEFAALVENKNVNEIFEKIGLKAGVNETKIQNCYQQQITAPLVEKDMNEAVSLGMRRTPTFYVNQSTATRNTLDIVITEELAKAGEK